VREVVDAHGWSIRSSGKDLGLHVWNEKVAFGIRTKKGAKIESERSSSTELGSTCITGYGIADEFVFALVVLGVTLLMMGQSALWTAPLRLMALYTPT
jgi:hypothetical protein